MYLKFIVGLFIFNFSSFAQINNNNIEVEYQELQEINALQAYTSSYGTLYTDNNVSIYKKYDDVDFSDQAHNKKNARPFEKDKTRKFSGNYLKMDIIKKEMLFFDFILSNHFLVKDIYHDFKWDISNDTKLIAGYTCTKATTSYRGRNWIAWFTPEIPVSFGPWKLHGLPGLILEAYDSKNEHTYIAVKIEAKKNEIFNKDFVALVKTKNTKPITFKQFLEDRIEGFNNVYKKMESEDPGVTYSDPDSGVPRIGPELKYEWEE